MSYIRKTTILASISILTTLAAATSSSANPAIMANRMKLPLVGYLPA